MEQLNGQLSLDGLDPLQHQSFNVRKRDGRVVEFDESRIFLAIESAFKAEKGVSSDNPLDEATQGAIQRLTEQAAQRCLAFALKGQELEVEKIQDFVETELMEAGHHAVARRYIVYREERKKARALRGARDKEGQPIAQLFVAHPQGEREPLDPQRISRQLSRACRGFEEICSSQALADETLQSLYDGVNPEEIDKAMILAARSKIEREPAYSHVAARLLLKVIYREVLGAELANVGLPAAHRAGFPEYLKKGVRLERLSPTLLEFEMPVLAEALRLERDQQFNYLGIQTIYDRYLIHDDEKRLETPQYFWMRVAMGLAIKEGPGKNERAIEFYEALSTFRFVASTPTLFNAGTLHPQLSSCYLSTVLDSLDHIFKVISDDAKLSKWAGGLGNDWTNIRASGSWIKGTNGRSQGVIPFLKVANDTAVAVNQGGKRKGAMCAYLETWHLDIGDFLELQRNTGDERRRTHDMHTAHWIPDLFMKRVHQNGQWTLFSPSDVPDLHDLYGAAFEKRYVEYEQMADRGEIKLSMRIEAVQLWRKMLTMLFETGHPWITFKDPSNIRSPQGHAGVVHSSNLCTEILLNTSKEETAVCNLGSINLLAHVKSQEPVNSPEPSIETREDFRIDQNQTETSESGEQRFIKSGFENIDTGLLSQTIRTAMRMLDNVIEQNFYPTPEARHSNLKHRPVGLGVMGFQDALYKLRIRYASEAAVEFADRSMEFISFHAILASTELAKERSAYPSFPGSKWDQGLLPVDTIALLERERGGFLDMDRAASLDWSPVRAALRRHGMRNSNCMAIAPTATISNITGVSQSIEPTYKQLFSKSNLSGEFVAPNTYLVDDLKRLGIWDDEMIDDLKYFDGSVQEIERIPKELKELYRTAFEIDPKWLIECASRRQKWIDMGQSLNLYLAEPNGKKLHEMYLLAWEKGLKTTYYLRSLAATQIEKSTTDANRRGVQPRWMKNKSASSKIQIDRKGAASTLVTSAAGTGEVTAVESADSPGSSACSVLGPDCESCQ